MTQAQVLDKFASLQADEKDLLLEVASNYLFDMAVAIRVPFKNIDAEDRLFKGLDFLAAGWEVANANSSRWRYLG
jgi:hypothetical protein